MGQKLKLELFIVGDSVRSETATDHLRQILMDAHVADECEMEVIDILQDPARAEQEKILATPTVIKKHSSGETRVVGDLSNHEQVAVILDLPTKPR